MRGEESGIAVGDILPQLHLFREDVKLGQEDRSLKGVQAAVDADAGVVVLVRAFAVNSDGIEGGGKFVVIGEAHSAVAVAAQRFGGEEGGAGNIGQGTGLFAFVFRPEGLGGVLDDEKTVLPGDGIDSIIIGRQAEEIDGDDTKRSKG